MTRREFALTTAAASAARIVRAADPIDLAAVRKLSSLAVGVNATEAASHLTIEKKWAGSVCTSKVINKGSAPVSVKEILLLDIPHSLPPATGFYGEGFQ